ncbi:TonB-dependent receptor [Duganella sp. FT3S]|uniref:TonB-dependent receptor n=1 Tax=Rugamonas fusca TaxID=2758568 RepID=A0A7W2EFE9_9BURK|nr:TonB-dependent receptor [Rugamonas fusca]MBA5604943.1 TonB-dependent receptor [Rugamonas fusca]
MSKLFPYACLALLATLADTAAQAQNAAPQPADASATAAQPAAGPDGHPIQQVTVSGGRASDMDERRHSTAAKQVYGREELDRNGDTSLADVLKRLPGVTIGGRPGRGGDIRMRGLGSGYTQILVNGERPPAGFSMDSLSPDQVERVEIMRGPVAEHSTRAIAGTINIVLREGYQLKDKQLKLTDTVEQGQHAPNVSLTVPGRVGNLTYLLTGTVFENRQHDHNTIAYLDAAGAVLKEQLETDASSRKARGIHLSPRLSYKFAGGDQLNFQPFLMSLRSDTTATSVLAQSIGQMPPEYATAATGSHADTTFLRGFGNWVHKLEGAAKLDVKFGFGLGHSGSDALRLQYDGAGQESNRFTDSDSTRDRSASSGGKYSTPLGKDHTLAAGWDVEASHREQTKTSLDKNGVAQFDDSGDTLSADTRRYAVFAQDEWDITSQWSAYAGLRWEGITTTSRRDSGDVHNTSSVLSPLLHGVWRIPGHARDQVRASLTKSYKAANVQDLIALPYLAHPNNATHPDRMGNPNLKPELANGVDLAYEHYLGRSGIVSVSGFVRDIDNLIRRTLTSYDTPQGPHYVSTPSNVGHAGTSGIELEAKFQLVELFDDAPAVDVRSNYSRFWSSVDGIPGPNNRLDQQARQTANLGVDYHLKQWPLTVGGSVNWTPATVIQTSLTQQVETGRKRAFDAYALWKVDRRNQLRISASNLAPLDSLSGNVVTARGVTSSADADYQTFTVWSVKLETKF